MKKLICATIIVVSTFSLTHAAVFNVGSGGGYDFSEIQAAIDIASNGDTIYVAPGTYSENINFNNKLLTLQSSAGADKTFIAGTGGTTVKIGNTASIEGFTISGGTASFGAGMSVSGNGTVITKNIFQFNNQGAGGFGAAIGGNVASPIISGNIFRNNSADSQHLSGVVSFINSSSPQIENNIFYQNETRAINFTVPQGAQPLVVNNTIVGNACGIYIDGRIGFSPDVFANNIVAYNGIGFESPFSGSRTPAIFSHNLLAGNGIDIHGLPDFIGLDGNITGDPFFVDAANYDFHLKAGSAALFNGSSLYAPAFDFDGRIRSTIAPSIGAYELYPNFKPVANAGEDQLVYAWIDEYALVQLDGTGSYDPDGDELEYFWFADSTEIATGAEPNVLFLVGEHVIELIVNDGIEDSEPNACIVTVIEALEAEAKLTPQALNRDTNRPHVIGRLELVGFSAGDLDPNEPMVLLPGGIEAGRVDILPAGDGADSITLMGFFDNASFMESIEQDGDVDVTIAAKLLSGQWVYGMDTVKIVAKKGK